MPTLTVEQASAFLQVTPTTVRSLIRKGSLRAARVGAQWRIRREDLDGLFLPPAA